ncbi:MAG: outer membrane protein assembly factor BamC [Chromatiales bacterium]|nr:outer membrane protein assembly factor BamC [Chromatiales bacterium]
MVSVLAGCSALPTMDQILPDKKAEYKKSKQAEKNLEIPPDLTRSAINDELVIPDAPNSGSATLSGLMAKEQVQTRSAKRATVLPQIEHIEVKRDGDQRWLVIQGDPEDVWYKVVEFWQDSGILLVEQDPTVGVMMTDWMENRAAIKTDFITDRIRRVFDGAYSASIQDQYRVRIEPGVKPGTTELYLAHRGMQEKIVQVSNTQVERTVWNPRPTDPDLEAEMLRRLMVYIGISDKMATTSLAENDEGKKQQSQLSQTRNEVSLVVNEGIDRTWRLTGVALDRVGFAVEDRNRSRGVYYVRYNDPQKEQEKSGFLSKLAFWRSEDEANVDKENQYQVALNREGEQTRILVLSEGGARDNSPTALRILTLIHEQIN